MRQEQRSYHDIKFPILLLSLLVVTFTLYNMTNAEATDSNQSNSMPNNTYTNASQVMKIGQQYFNNVANNQNQAQNVISHAENGGGCLIATAAYGSELAPQVQQLRETRDNVLLHTQSGTVFMNSFNQFYYTFSPTVADLERQNPVFKEAVKITITPLLTTLSILNYLNIDSEAKMITYGIAIILLNIGIYFVGPAFAIVKLRQHDQAVSRK